MVIVVLGFSIISALAFTFFSRREVNQNNCNNNNNNEEFSTMNNTPSELQNSMQNSQGNQEESQRKSRSNSRCPPRGCACKGKKPRSITQGPELESSNSRSYNVIPASSSSQDDSKIKMKNLEDQIESLKRKKDQLEEDIDSLKTRIESMENKEEANDDNDSIASVSSKINISRMNNVKINADDENYQIRYRNIQSVRAVVENSQDDTNTEPENIVKEKDKVIKKLNHDIENYEKQIKVLKKTVSATAAEIKQKESQIEKISEEKEDLRKIIKDRELGIKRASEDLILKEKERKGLLNQINENRMSLQLSEAEKRKLERTMRQSLASADQNKKCCNCDEKAAKIKQVEASVRSQTSNIEDLKKQLKDKDEEIKNLKEQVSKGKEYLEEIQAAYKKLKDSMAEDKHNYQELIKISKLQEDEIINKLKEDLTRLEEELEDAKLNWMNEVGEQRNIIQDLDQQLNSTQNESDYYKSSLEQCEMQIEDKNQIIAQERQKFAQIQAAITTLQNEIHDGEQTIKSLQNNLDTINQESQQRGTMLKSELDKAKKSSKLMEDDLKHKLAKAKQNSEEIEQKLKHELNNQRQISEDNIKRIKRELSQTKQRSEETIQELKFEIEHTNENNSTNVEKLQTELSDTRRKSENEILKLQNELISVRRQSEQVRTTLELKLSDERRNFREVRTTLELQLAEARRFSEDVVLSLNQERRQSAELCGVLQTRDNEDVKLQEEISQLKAELENKQRLIEKLKLENFNLNKKLTINEIKLKSIEEENNILQNQIYDNKSCNCDQVSITGVASNDELQIEEQPTFSLNYETRREINITDKMTNKDDENNSKSLTTTIKINNDFNSDIFQEALNFLRNQTSINLNDNQDLNNLHITVQDHAKKLIMQVKIMNNINQAIEKLKSEKSPEASNRAMEIKREIIRKIQELEETFKMSLSEYRSKEAETLSAATDELADYIMNFQRHLQSEQTDIERLRDD